MRIREFTIKLKTPNGLNELENEPAYARKKISLDNSARSTESNISRYSLNESVDENGNKKVELKGNSFLHDNVD
jgi:cell division protein FtsZ